VGKQSETGDEASKVVGRPLNWLWAQDGGALSRCEGGKLPSFNSDEGCVVADSRGVIRGAVAVAVAVIMMAC
jgi:hypothetical protein